MAPPAGPLVKRVRTPQRTPSPRAQAAPPSPARPVRRLILGLMGGIGAGKSTVTTILRKRIEATAVDADALAREVLDVCARDGRLAEALGAWAIAPDGTANRKIIGARVFDQPTLLRSLERVTHPAILARIDEAIEAHRAGEGPPLLILDVPLLIETGLERRCDALWFVDAPDEMRFARAEERLKLSRADVLKREAAQYPLDRKRARADLVLGNDGSLEHLEAAVDAGIASLAG
jgi:dephospho-CoA kinase